MHEVQHCFEYLIQKTERIPTLNKTQKEIILKDLNYFLTQSKCHEDRRNRPEVIQNKWKEFKNKVCRTPLLIEPKGFFKTMSDFVGMPHSDIMDSKEIERLERMDVPELFEDLILGFESKKTFFTTEEQEIIYCGLKFLLAESKAPRLKRDVKGISKTWKIIKPKMEKYGLFYKYIGAKNLSSKLRFFLTREL